MRSISKVILITVILLVSTEIHAQSKEPVDQYALYLNGGIRDLNSTDPILGLGGAKIWDRQLLTLDLSLPIFRYREISYVSGTQIPVTDTTLTGYRLALNYGFYYNTQRTVFRGQAGIALLKYYNRYFKEVYSITGPSLDINVGMDQFIYKDIAICIDTHFTPLIDAEYLPLTFMVGVKYAKMRMKVRRR